MTRSTAALHASRFGYLILACMAVSCAQGQLGSDDEEVRTRPDPSSDTRWTDDTTAPPPTDASSDLAPSDDVAPTDGVTSDLPDTRADRQEDDGDTIDVSDTSCGGCGDDRICREGRCVDPCSARNATCGRLDIEGQTVRCGDCSSGRYCTNDRACADICGDSGDECGEVFWGGKSTTCGRCTQGTCVNNRCLKGGGYRAVAAGDRHTCAVRSDGTVACWGRNNVEQIDGSRTDLQPSPVDIGSLSNATELDADRNHTCVLTGGRIQCWGSNTFEQSGLSGSQTVYPPNTVGSLDRVEGIAVGDRHSCALLETGGARCWGYGLQGRLGNRNTGGQTYASPVSVQTSASFVTLAAGTAHTCGLTRSGHVQCWGNGQKGRLGRGVRPSSPETPERVQRGNGQSLRGVIDLAAGAEHTCAVQTSGRVQCWGAGNNGQIGDGQTSNRFFATPVQGLTDARRIAAGRSHTCALQRDGSVACWGNNADGQLGVGDTQPHPEPVELSQLNRTIDLAGGRAHTCAVTSQGGLYCWGRNESGQLGTGMSSSTPTDVPKRIGP